MRLRFPLYAQLTLWLVLNLLLIAGLYFALPGRAGAGWAVLLTPPVRSHVSGIGQQLAAELGQTTGQQWNEVFARYAAQYGVGFALGEGPEGPGGEPPPFDRRGPGPDRQAPPPGPGGFDSRMAGEPPPSMPDEQRPPPATQRSARMLEDLVFITHRSAFGGFEVSIPADLAQDGRPPRPITFVASAPTLRGLLGFLGVADWVLFGVLAALLSVLLWWPLLWSITRTVRRLTRATREIAEGRFDTRVASARPDELGELAQSVDRMAARLQAHLAGQQQFLADVAHEVTSPLARVQIGLGILEARIDPALDRALRDVQDNAQQMSGLLEELLLFSRAGAQAERPALVSVDLGEVIAATLEREDPARRVAVEIAAGLRAQANPAMLARALANLVRNALRYGGAGEVRVAATADADGVHLLVRDHGPGVPAAMLPRLGEAFFRGDESRSRDTGGHGLGLAIVRRCVAACGGSVSFRNAPGGGFEAGLHLQRG